MWGRKKSKTNQDQQKGQANQTVQRRSTFGASTSYSSTMTTSSSFFHSSETVQRGSQSQTQNRTIANSLPSTSSAPPSSSFDIFSIDARPIVPTTIIPNYQSTFQRNRPYSSTRSILNSPASSSVTRATSSINSLSRPSISASTVPSTIQTKTNSSEVSRYNTSGKNRGNALIINIIKFMDDNDEREGAELDEKNVCKLFKDMGFNVEKHRNLKLDDMKRKIQSFRKSRALANGDISVVIIMSHGTNKDNNNLPVSGSFTQIISADGKCLDTEDVVAEFSTEKCPGMKGKPKIFIFQCCRGEREELQVDCIPRRRRNVVKDHADMLIAFSTLPNFFSIRDPQKGSWYIQCICEVFRQHAKVMHVERLLKKVDERLSEMHRIVVQTSTYESRGFNKECFFNPKW